MNLSLFLRLGRVSNLPTVCSNVLAGAILSGASPSLNSVALLCLTFSAFYIGGMFLNDAFDAEYDQEHRPERPIPRGEIERAVVYTMGGALLVLGIMLVMGHGILFENTVRTEPALYALALAVCIIWYNADHQQNFMAPVLMGLNRVYVYATTAFILTPEPDQLLWYGCGAILSYLIGLTFLAQQEDLTRIHRLWPALFLIAPLGYPVAAVSAHDLEPSWGIVWGLSACLAAWIIWSISLMRREKNPQVKRGIVSLIAGISLLDGIAGGLMGAPLIAIAAVVAFMMCLGAQSVVSGT